LHHKRGKQLSSFDGIDYNFSGASMEFEYSDSIFQQIMLKGFFSREIKLKTVNSSGHEVWDIV
jgi:hypothetical protein